MKDGNLDSAEIPKIVFSPKMDAFGTVDLAVGPAMCSFVPESELLGEEYGSYRRDMAHSGVLEFTNLYQKPPWPCANPRQEPLKTSSQFGDSQ
jgi:hypothetical protein